MLFSGDLDEADDDRIEGERHPGWESLSNWF
jgi:hypothetical protein